MLAKEIWKKWQGFRKTTTVLGSCEAVEPRWDGPDGGSDPNLATAPRLPVARVVSGEG